MIDLDYSMNNVVLNYVFTRKNKHYDLAYCPKDYEFDSIVYKYFKQEYGIKGTAHALYRMIMDYQLLPKLLDNDIFMSMLKDKCLKNAKKKFLEYIKLGEYNF